MKIKYINLLPLIIFLCVIGGFYPKIALAYLDPGTGSFIVQIVVAGVAGAAFAIKIFFRQIKNFISRVFSRGKKNKN